MKRSALFFASALILAGEAFADRGNHNGRGPVDVDLGLDNVIDATVDIGGDSVVNADLDVLDNSGAGDVSDVAASAVDYATRQVNSGNQSATLNLLSGAMGDIAGTAAAIGNSYSIESVADAVSSVNQANSGAAYANANVSINNSGIATATTAAIGNTASVTSEVSTLATRSTQ